MAEETVRRILEYVGGNPLLYAGCLSTLQKVLHLSREEIERSWHIAKLHLEIHWVDMQRFYLLKSHSERGGPYGTQA